VTHIGRKLNGLLASTLGVELVRQPGVQINDEWVKRFLYFDRLLERIERVEGDVAECGVAGGASLAMLASLVRARGGGRLVLGFDSWRGLPPPRPEDLASDVAAAEPGLFAWAAPEVVLRELRGHGLGLDAVKLVEGRFAETLPRFEGRLALVHVDADLYESYLDALRHLWPKLAVGGLAAFDEYELDHLWPGPRRAVDEFVAALPAGAAELRRDERIGKWYAVKALA